MKMIVCFFQMRINLETLHYQLLIIFTFFIICKSIQDQESEEYDLMEYITPNKRYTTDFPRKVCGSSLTDAVLYHCRGIINKKKSDPCEYKKYLLLSFGTAHRVALHSKIFSLVVFRNV